ncbi:unnamed protein product [Tuber aestivum]|uniref:Uncharacterized protein n=1 Tax=Tuber aestivum TaxID=59557 RepID=A0A292PZV9_9PEZI|nr:unnamed protein product [Tuber aestivum]
MFMTGFTAVATSLPKNLQTLAFSFYLLYLILQRRNQPLEIILPHPMLTIPRCDHLNDTGLCMLAQENIFSQSAVTMRVFIYSYSMLYIP